MVTFAINVLVAMEAVEFSIYGNSVRLTGIPAPHQMLAHAVLRIEIDPVLVFWQEIEIIAQVDKKV